MLNDYLIHDETPAGRKRGRPPKILKTHKTDPPVLCKKLNVKQFNQIKVKDGAFLPPSKDKLTPIIPKKPYDRNEGRPRKIPKNVHKSKKKPLIKKNMLKSACRYPSDKIRVWRECAVLSKRKVATPNIPYLVNKSLSYKKDDLPSTIVTEVVVHVDGNDCEYFGILSELSEDNSDLVDKKKTMGPNNEVVESRFKSQKELLKHFNDKSFVKDFDPLVLCEKLSVKQLNEIKVNTYSRYDARKELLEHFNEESMVKDFDPLVLCEKLSVKQLNEIKKEALLPIMSPIIEIPDNFTVELETEISECDSRGFQNSNIVRKCKLMSDRKRRPRIKLRKSPIRILSDVVTSSFKSRCKSRVSSKEAKNKPKAATSGARVQKSDKLRRTSVLSRIDKTRQSQLKDKQHSLFKRSKKRYSKEAVAVPFSTGWKRELVERSTSAKTGVPLFDVYYFTPEGVKLRSMKEISSYLHPHNEKNFTVANFSFAKTLIFNEPLEVKRKAKVKFSHN